MVREVGSYCFINLQKLLDEGCITLERYNDLVKVKELSDANPAIAGLSTGAVVPLIREKDTEKQAKVIEAVGKAIKHGNIPTAKQVKQLLQNKEEGVISGGHIQKSKGSDEAIDLATKTKNLSVAIKRKEIGEKQCLVFQQDTYDDIKGMLEDALDEGWATKPELIKMVSEVMHDVLDVAEIRIKLV